MFFEKKMKILMVDFVGFERTVKVISFAKGLASKSKNPMAKAICELEPNIKEVEVNLIKEFSDYGILGQVDNDKVLLGNEKIMKENNITLNGDTAHKLFFAINSQVQAVFRFDD